MRLFIDSAHIEDIKEAFNHGLVSGLTLNPALVAKEPPHPQGYIGHLKDIIRHVPDVVNHPFSVQPPIDALRESPKEAVGIIRGALGVRPLAIKVPMSWESLPLIRTLAGSVPVNVTCIYSAKQALAAIDAGARYVSFFWCRMYDNGINAALEVEITRNLIEKSSAKINTEILCGSIRLPDDVIGAFGNGSHIVTTGLNVLKQLADDPISQASADEMQAKGAAWDESCKNIEPTE